MTKKEAYGVGYNHGYEAACYCEPQDGEDLLDAAYKAAENAEQYSPFEFLAHKMNTARNRESLWEAYEDGVSEGIAAGCAYRQGPDGTGRGED